MTTFHQFLESKELNSNEITKKIKALNLEGWGGLCGNAAIEINHKIFNKKGTYIAAVNKFLWDFEDHLVGHVAVKFNGKLYDTTGLTTIEKLKSWGIVDEHDPDYTELFGWTTDAAYEVEIIEMTEEQIKHWFNICDRN